MGVLSRWNGTAWVGASVQERAAAAWAAATATVRSGGFWQIGTSTTFNIGETAILPTADNDNANLTLAQSAALTEQGTVQSLSFYVRTAAGQLYLGIYDATGPGGGPGALKASTAVFTPVVGWNTKPVITPVALAAGIYWLAYAPSSGSLAFVKGAGQSIKLYSRSFAALPATFSTTPTSEANVHWSFYATFTTAGSPPPPPAVPTIAGISPNPASAGPVTITGTNFVAGATVSFGGTAATGVTVNSATQITCTAPAHADGTVNVTVTTSAGTSNAVTFTYQATPPPPPPGTRQIDGGPNFYGQFSNPLPDDPSFFPIAVWMVSAGSQSELDWDKGLGINTYIWPFSTSSISLIASNGMWAIPNFGDGPAGDASNRATVGWVLDDEVDMREGTGGITHMQNEAAALPADGRFRYANFGKGIAFGGAGPSIWGLSDADCSRYINITKPSSIDIYWFTDDNVDYSREGGMLFNGGTRNLNVATEVRRAANYGYVVDRMRMLDAMDGARQPIWNFVEMAYMFTRAIQPAEMKAAAWHSIIAGARGLIWFPQAQGGPHPNNQAHRDSNYAPQQQAMREVGALIKRLAPVLNAPFDDGYASVTASVRAMSKVSAGKHWVFSGSKENVSSTATFTLTGVTTGTAVVEDENRSIPIVGGRFSDSFADGNAVHIYRID